MRLGPSSRREPYDFTEDLVQDINVEYTGEKEDNSADSKNICPHVLVSFFNCSYWALVDSGSQVTCISERVYQDLLSSGPIYELPVSNVQVLTAVGKKVTSVRKQVMLSMTIDSVHVDHI